MYVPSNSPKYICKKCHNKIPVTDLEGIFHEQLKRFLFSPEDIAAHLREANAMIGEKEEHLRVLEAERERVRRDMDKLYQLYLDDGITKGGFGERYHPLEERLRQIEEELPRTQAEHDLMKITYLSSDQVIADARDLYGRWPELPTEEKRQIIEAITENVIVGKEEVAINLLYVPFGSK